MNKNTYKELHLNDLELNDFYNKLSMGKVDYPLNTYLIICNEEGEQIDHYVQKESGLRPVKGYEIPRAFYMEQMKPRNSYQRMAIDMLMDKDSKVKILTGVFGSGKTLLGIAAAMKMIDSGKFDSLIWVRNNVEVAGVPALGALPGDLQTKLSGWTAVLADKLGGPDAIEQLEAEEIVKVEHLGFARGRDWQRSVIYMTEGQNMTGEIAKLLLGRVGEGSVLIIDGDLKQTDKRLFESDNGLNLLVSALTGNELFAHVNLPISERSEVAALASVVEEWQKEHDK